MQTIAIYVGPYPYGGHWDERNLEIGHIGGSEIWAIEIANEFARRGYKVMVFGDPEEEHVTENGVEYIKYSDFKKRNEESDGWDHIITSRRVDAIDDDIKAKDIILMCHDILVIGCDNYDDLKLGTKIDKICYQSLYQKLELRDRYNIPENKFMATYEGIDMSRYGDVDKVEKKNKMLWSSGKGRGIIWLIENVFPEIRKQVPDFEISICGYFDDFNEPIFQQEGIKVLGNITKDELVREQMSSKIWIYPNHGINSVGGVNAETFSITAIENGAAKNALILSDWGCWFTTLRGYEGFVGNGLFFNPMIPMDSKYWKTFATVLSEVSIGCLQDETFRKSLANSAYKVSKKYTWGYAADSFENEWKELEKNRK